MTNGNDDGLDQEPQQAPVDPLENVIEEIQFGDKAEAAGKLRAAMDREACDREYRNARAADGARSRAALERVRAERADIAEDKLASAVVERHMYELQKQDLARAGADWVAFKEKMGREPTPEEIANWHKHHRTIGDPNVRGVDELLKDSIDGYHEWSGRPKPSRSPSETVRARSDADRQRRGLPPMPRGDVPVVERDRWADSHSPAQETWKQMGGGDEAGPDQDQARTNAAQRMRLERRALRGPGAQMTVDPSVRAGGFKKG